VNWPVRKHLFKLSINYTTMKVLILFFTIFLFSTLNVLAQQKKTTVGKADVPKHDAPITKPLNTAIGEAGNDYGFDMAPETTPKVVEAAVKQIHAKVKAAKGTIKPTWESVQANYKVPEWFRGAKFGLFMHWGLYSVPAYHNEWYEKHMYGELLAWHSEHFGPQEKFGYKDFIPMFTQDKFDPDAWAELFKKSGARFVVPSAQHHDNFALWDSKVTPYNAKQMGPKRDLIGELSKAVRKQGLKFGVSNHGIENFQFINPPPALLSKLKNEKADLFDPKWADFYNVADRSDAACQKFLVNWYERNVELIDKYQPDMLWFDNGVDQRYLDPLKLNVASYYYNRAKQWGKEVSLSTKKAAMAPSGTNIQTIGSILDFEGKVPPGIRSGVWQVDSPIGSSWGYTNDMHIASAGAVVNRLLDIVSKNGTLLLNLSPKPDGTFPQEQQETLFGVGKWLGINGEAIYDTHNWTTFAEGGQALPKIYFTVKGTDLYAIISGKWPVGSITIASLAQGKVPEGHITSVSLLGSKEKLTFSQDNNGLKVNLPANPPCDIAYTLKISGLKMNPYTPTVSGNPVD
jgi:alpha-L-fucosidase